MGFRNSIAVTLGSLLAGIVMAAEPTIPPSSSAAPLYKNPQANIEDRVNDLIGRMTVEEKVSQM